MPTLTTPSTVTFSLQIDQILTITTNFGAGRIVLSAQRGGDVVFDYTGDNLLNTPVFSSGSQGIVTITHLSGSLTYNVNDSVLATLTTAQAAAVAPVSVYMNSVSDAAANARAINAALTTTGKALLIGNGTDICWISRTIEPSAWQSLKTYGVSLKLAPGSNCNIVRNRSAQQSINPTNSVEIVSSVLARLNLPGHNLAVGGSVYIVGARGNTTLNGVKVISAISGNLVSVPISSGAALTNTAQQPVHVGRYNPLAGSNFVRSSNVVTVTETGHKRLIGDHVYIAALSGANTFNGMARLTGSVPGVSWSYANTGANETATGTAQLAGDTMLDIDLWETDYNFPSNIYSDLDAVNVTLGNIGNSSATMRLNRNGPSRSVQIFNAGYLKVPFAHAEGQKGTFQIESNCHEVHVGEVSLQNGTDDIIAWGVTGDDGAFGGTECPSGPGSMGTLRIDHISGASSTGVFKLFGATPYHLGDVKIGKVSATGPIVMGDLNVGATGASVGSVTIDQCDNKPELNGNQILITNGGLVWGRLHIGLLVDNAPTPTTTGYLVNLGAVPTVTIENLMLPIA